MRTRHVYCVSHNYFVRLQVLYVSQTISIINKNALEYSSAVEIEIKKLIKNIRNEDNVGTMLNGAACRHVQM